MKYPHQMSSLHLDIKISDASPLTSAVKKLKFRDFLPILLPLLALLLWSASLQHEDVRHMNDLGMISTFPPLIFVAVALLILSFGLTLLRAKVVEPVLFLHLILLICMLYATQSIVEEAPRFAVVYRHAGYTDYIMRTGSVDQNLDAYFSWPGFFVLSALVTQLAGYHDILGYAGWAPLFYNVIYIAPLYLLLTSLTTDKRLVWLSLWFFFLTNWIGQDYFSPQGLDFFMYLVIIAMLLRWFQPALKIDGSPLKQRFLHSANSSSHLQKIYRWITVPIISSSPISTKQKLALLGILLVIFAFVVFSHPLTPFFILASVLILALFNRCSPRWLPIVMGIMVAAWIVFMTRTFLEGHSSMVVGSVGQVSDAVTTNVTSHIQGNTDHMIVAAMRLIMTAVIWGLAFFGGFRRLRQGQSDIVALLLALAPFPLIAAQQYGGEMFLRIYLFSLPFMVFFAAAFFFPRLQLSQRALSRKLAVLLLCLNFLLFCGFLFTRYGNERMDYVTYSELAGIRALYHLAPAHSLFIGAGDVTPWPFQDFEKYTYDSMDDNPNLSSIVATQDVHLLVGFLRQQNAPHSYVVFTRGQQAQLELFYGLPSGALGRFATALVTSGNFKMVYHNTDVQIYILLDHPNGGNA